MFREHRRTWQYLGVLVLITAIFIAAFSVLIVPGLPGRLFLIALWLVSVASLVAFFITGHGDVRVSDVPPRHVILQFAVTVPAAVMLEMVASSLGIEPPAGLGRGLLAGVTFGTAWIVGDLVATLVSTRARASSGTQ